ncbi:hypothetical protein [Streptomyces orinoci]|uniref:Uncharacterized protein n=1 Tax=Streptomyces orinoci TaxID=67339 RepID=A0ABV3JRN4_STRON|nr:hypothetical protein [Streptomyces orinoci]
MVYETAPAASRSPSREAIARIDLAIAHALLGEPQDALVLGHQALGSTRVLGSVRNRARELASFLTRRYPRLEAARGFQERLLPPAGQPQPPEGTL